LRSPSTRKPSGSWEAGCSIMSEEETRGERREGSRRKRRKMRVVGRSVRALQDIIRRRAEKARKEDDKPGESS